jgi:hypothetical protein
MAKVFAAEVRIVSGTAGLAIGAAYANVDGISAKGGGIIPWHDVLECRAIEKRAGGAAAGMVAGGAIGLIGGPPGAVIGAGLGAFAGMVTGSVELFALRLQTGADILIEVPIRQSKQFQAAASGTPSSGARIRLPRWGK